MGIKVIANRILKILALPILVNLLLVKPLAAEPLLITMKSNTQTARELKAWQNACKNLAKFAKAGLGGMGKSVFSNPQCVPLGQTASEPAAVFFELSFDQTTEPHQVSAFLSKGSSKTLLYQTTRLKLEPRLLKKIARDNKVARALMDVIKAQMPYTNVVALNGKNPRFGAKNKKLIASRYYAADFFWAETFWQANIHGILTRTKKLAKGFRFRYETYRERQGGSRGQAYLIPDSQERLQLINQAESVAAETLKGFFLADLLHETLGLIGSSQLGLRYGYPLYPTESVVAQASMFAMNLEIRDGPFGGLRWYWEIAPNTERPLPERPELIESITYSRAAFGWSLSLALPKFLSGFAERLDIVPKIGLLDVDGRFAIAKGFDIYERASFVLKNVVDLGLELGLEYPVGDFGMRVTGAANWAHASLSLTNNNANLFSYRSSLDIFYTAGQFLGFDVRLFGFGSMERLNLVQNIAAEDRQEASAIRDVTFNLFFLGLGGSLAW